MSFGKLFTFVFGIIFIILLYVIIYYALKIMYKDVKTGGKAKNNNLYVEDLNSTNGVYVNNERIEEKYKLIADDEVKIGSAIFKVLKSGK